MRTTRLEQVDAIELRRRLMAQYGAGHGRERGLRAHQVFASRKVQVALGDLLPGVYAAPGPDERAPLYGCDQLGSR